MAFFFRHAPLASVNKLSIYMHILLLLPLLYESATVYDKVPNFDENGRRLTREYHLRQGAIRGLVVKPSRQYELQNVEIFLGIPYAAPPVGSLRFMPPVSAPPWSGVKTATHFAPVCPQTLPPIKKGNPPSLGRQMYRQRLEKFLKTESEDCLYLNIYVPYREQKTKQFPILVFVHGDSFEYSSGNPYDGRILASYGNIMVITINYRLGVLGFMKPSLTEHVYGNNGLLDQLAALQWIKDNIEDLNGDPRLVTLMGHGTGAACVNFLMMSPISNGLFHRAILMSGSALSDWAMTKDPSQYTLQVAQSLGCNPSSKDMMTCLQSKPLSEIKRIQILSRDFETPLGPIVAGAFIPNEPTKTMTSFPNLLSKYQLLCGVTELESYHDFGVIELDHGILENQRDEFLTKYAKVAFEGAEDVALKDILKQYSTSKLDPRRWGVETNRDVVLNIFSDARALSPMVKLANYQSNANRQSYFYVFGHNSISTDFAALNKSVHGEELPYVLGVPLGGTNTHFHSEFTHDEKLLSGVVMRLWTNFVKIGTPNTQSLNEYYNLDSKTWSQFNVDWPEYNIEHQSYLRLDIPPHVSSFYRSNYTKFWIETLPNKMQRYQIDPLYEFTSAATVIRTFSNSRDANVPKKQWQPAVTEKPSTLTYGKLRPYAPPERITEDIYREIQAIKNPARPIPHGLMDKPRTISTSKPIEEMVITEDKTSSATISLIITFSLLFIAANIAICTLLYMKKRKLARAQNAGDFDDVDGIAQKIIKEDTSAFQTFKAGCCVFKSMGTKKIGIESKKAKKYPVRPKTPKSDDSGGFRERFQLRRHLSTSTIDAHTKVRDWIANEVIHRCSPSVRTSHTDLDCTKYTSPLKPFTRSEELLSPSKIDKKNIKDKDLISTTNKSTKISKISEKTTSTSACGSDLSIKTHERLSNSSRSKQKSSDSIKSKGSGSTKSKKVSVAIDATPAARTNSILRQEPIELSKSMDFCQNDQSHSTEESNLLIKKTDNTTDNQLSNKNVEVEETSFTSALSFSLNQEKPLKIMHKHSSSDPVTDFNYGKIKKEKVDSGTQVLLPPISFRNDINVTSREESDQIQPLTAAEALLTIKRRNYPKVLPDLPKYQKRLSLQPNSLQTFKNFISNTENMKEYQQKVPPQPPPRTTTLERRLAYQNLKSNVSSFNSIKSSVSKDNNDSLNYENVDNLSPKRPNVLQRSFESTKSDASSSCNERFIPKVVIASNEKSPTESKIIIQATTNHIEIPKNAPRVRLPDDFHSQTSGSITSFSSFASDDDVFDDELPDDELDDQLLQELVGAIDTDTNIHDEPDTKGPDTFSDKNLEIVRVKVNPGAFIPKNKEDYVCITDLQLPGINDSEKTAQIKSNFSINKLKNRSESINKPLEKAVKIKQRKGIKPILLTKPKNKQLGNYIGNIENSSSDSSNDTENSAGTVVHKV